MRDDRDPRARIIPPTSGRRGRLREAVSPYRRPDPLLEHLPRGHGRMQPDPFSREQLAVDGLLQQDVSKSVSFSFGAEHLAVDRLTSRGQQAPLVEPGRYRAQLARVVGETTTPMGEVRLFNVVPLTR